MHNFTFEKKRVSIGLTGFIHQTGNIARLIVIRKLAIILFFLFFSALLFAQTAKPEDKIDMAFRFLLSHKEDLNDKATFKNFPQQFKIAPTEGFVPGKMVSEKRYDCIVYTRNARALRDSSIIVRSVLPTFVTAWVTLEQISKMAFMPDVQFIEAPQTDGLHNDVSVGNSGAGLLHAGKLNNTKYKGKGIIVAIYDSGIDWDHPDFRNPDDTTKSRILRIWDQTLTAIAGETTPAAPLNYGVEYTQVQINDELDGSPTGFVRERDGNGHGSHVAGTAAGNGAALSTRKYTGIAPEADIVVIKGGEGSFSETNIINGITYLQNLATSLGKPVVLNMSLGGHTGAHDGSRVYEQTVDNFTASAPGRAVVISAGNDNGTNLHNRVSLAGNATTTISFTVPAGTTGTDVFQYRVYANDSSAVTATATAPGGSTVTATVGQMASGFAVSDSFNVFVNNLVDINNNDRYVNLYITRRGANRISPAGTWTLTITNNTTNTLTLDGWLTYRNSVFANTALVGGDNNNLVGSPGNATSALTVASFVGRASWYSSAANSNTFYTTARQDSISTFSAHGPRRDGVLKPEIAANGQGVLSVLSSNSVPTSSDVVVNGLYVKNQGTSMSAPVTTGAVALMLQANPAATVAQLKTAIFSTANKDALTETAEGATPNTTWGYGRLDVFKAVNTAFNCTPITRKTFQYDYPNLTSQDNGVAFTTQRIAVRFTPDLTGKLGGAFYHTSTSKTALVLEVRTNNAGVPGSLLGTVDLSDSMVAQYSWNYVDLTEQNIAVTSGTDYFMILYRSSSSVAGWSLRRENTALDNRSLTSTNGISWTNPGFDYKIRSVVYSNSQIAGNIAAANAIDTRNINTSNQFISSSCALIAQLLPAGASPVSGTVTANVWLEPAVPHFGADPFVSRHYQIMPAVAEGNVTGKVTLYFTQAEFTAFNGDAASTLDLPTNPTDAVGKANLRIGKYPGTSSDGSGLPGTYSGAPVILDPADSDIVWNAEASRWEISFGVTGFSGFVVQTTQYALPIVTMYFSGSKQNGTHLLDWKVACTGSAANFEIQRSADGANFNTLGKVLTTVARCLQPFAYTDASPLGGTNYYRIKMTESNGKVYYTNIILLQSDKLLTNGVYPTFIAKGAAVQVSYSGIKGNIIINDAAGKQVYTHTLRNGVQSISFPSQASGVYFYRIVEDATKIAASGKLIVQ